MNTTNDQFEQLLNKAIEIVRNSQTLEEAKGKIRLLLKENS